MHSILRRWLTETAYYAVQTGVTNAGDAVYGSPVAFLCRSEYDIQMHGPMALPRHGEDFESFSRLFTETAVPLDARIWPPGADESEMSEGFHAKRREVIRTDLGTISHYEIYY
jgi:hypothetical protein